MKHKFAYLLLPLFLLTVSSHTVKHVPLLDTDITTEQTQIKGAINWITWEEAMELHQKNKKKIIVSVFRKNCNWCKKMDSETFGNPEVVKYISDNFYAVKFDAEQSNEINVEGKTYKSVKKSGKTVHEFTAFLTMGQMSTPTTVFFDQKLELLQPLPGYKKTELFEIIMTYFGGDHYLRIPWSRYKQEYAQMTD